MNHEKSQVVQTSWAGLALMYARYPHREPLQRAVRLVMSRQLPVRVPLRVRSVSSAEAQAQDGAWASAHGQPCAETLRGTHLHIRTMLPARGGHGYVADGD